MPWTVQLSVSPPKTVVLSGFNIETANVVAFTVEFVELDHLQRRWTIDFANIQEWLTANSGKTWKDYCKDQLLDVYNRFLRAKTMVDYMNAEAVEAPP